MIVVNDDCFRLATDVRALPLLTVYYCGMYPESLQY